MSESAIKCVCIYCGTDVSALRIECAECHGDINLCPQCFSCGAEIGEHLKTHSYKVISSDPPLFQLPEHWSCSEEQIFLEVVGRFPFGNWNTIAEMIKSRTAEELERHYVNMYLYGNIGKATQPCYNENFKFEIEDFSSPINGKDIPGVDLSAVPPKGMCDKICYNPKLGYFREPYDQEAESDVLKVVSKQPLHYNFQKEEKDIHRSLKGAYLNIYQSRLKKRAAIEQLVRDYNLVKVYDSKAANTDSSGQEKEESRLRDSMKAYCRLMKPSEHEELIQGELREMALKAKLSQLKERVYKQPSQKNNSKNLAAKSEPVTGKQNKSKENKLKKNFQAAKSISPSEAASEKEAKKSSSTVSGSKSRKRPFQEENTEGHYSESCQDMLSHTEKKLCSNLSLEPSSYLALKIVLLKERNVMKEDEPGRVWNNPTRNKTIEKVSKFMTKNKWIKAG